MKNNNKWKRICSGILAVCLVATLLLSNQSFGVFAKENGIQVQESQTEENNTEVSSEEILENTEGVNGFSGADKSEECTQERGFYADDSSAEKNDEWTSGGEDAVEVQSEGDTNLQADTEISNLIDADIALLNWKRTKEETTVSVANQTYIVSDKNSFTTAYTVVCTKLKEYATEVSGSISAQTISGDVIWNITDTVNMNGNVTVNNNARLVILGTGAILRNSSYTLINKGTLCLQESVYMNGNEQSGTLVSMTNGTTYLTDEFHIGNCPSSTGVITTGGSFEMSGGLIGTKNITFEWKDENDESLGNKSYEETLNYIETNINSNRYDYVSGITATDGCIRGINIGSGSQFYMSGGVIAGNIGDCGLNLGGDSQITGGMIFGNATKKENGWGGGINDGATSTKILGGKIFANYATGYGGAINAGVNTVFGNNVVVAYNSALCNGGAAVVNGGRKVSLQGNALIAHNTAIGADVETNTGSGNGGAFRVVGTLDISGGTISYNYANGKVETNQRYLNSGNGGAISAQTDSIGRVADIKLLNGSIQYNKSRENGGAIWSACMASSLAVTFRLEGTIIKNNFAGKNGGGVYLAARSGAFTADIIGGELSGNSAGTSGGGMYLELGDVNGSLGKSITVNIGEQNGNNSKLLISNNKAQKNGGALYIGRSEKNTSENNTIDVNFYSGTMQENSAANGGGIGIVQGELTLYGGVTSSNTATENGGGVYLSGGNLAVSGGSFTQNRAQNGGGIFLDAGHMTLSGGRIYNNQAMNGAGAYLNGGNLTMSDSGHFDSNTASGDGGGAYLAGGTLTINGGVFGNNTAINGGGAYAADGKVRMFGGNVTNNTAKQSGGGFYVSSDKQAADVVIRSGTISGNKAGSVSKQGNGGAIAVVSNSTTANQDHVVIGLRHQHQNLDLTTRKFTPFGYTDSIDSTEHTHESCPTIKDNQASGNGGGIYMDSSKSVLDIYCLLEADNKAEADENGGSIMSVGGNVNIGDVGEDGNGNNTADAAGNILIKSKMLVRGGVVKIFGNTDNPRFADQVLVDIRETTGSFSDNRYSQMADDVNYKIEYFENFNGSGMFTAIQYDAKEDIPSMGTMYTHKGYKIIGWATNKNATVPTYTTESGVLIGSESDHSAWDGKKATEALKLYAIWQKISYTVEYHPNATEYKGNQMENQSFIYGEIQELARNIYKVKGKRFLRWNTEKNGTGQAYEASYNESKMSSKDGETIPLYAQWVDCTHHGGTHDGILSYSLNDKKDTIMETCDCENYSETLKISGADVYYDGKSHPASVTGKLYAETPKISYSYKTTSSGTYGNMPDGTTVPIKEGYYKASITLDEKTAFVEYQIKLAASAATIDVAAKKGQHFTDMNGDSSCTVAQDDAFTIQYQVQALNKGTNEESQKGFITVPVLTLSQALPTGTTIIMQTGDTYWYNNHPNGTELALTSFVKMGGTDWFSYDTADVSEISDAQTYRFIIDFSQVKSTEYFSENENLEIGLRYDYTNPATGKIETERAKEEKATIIIGSKAAFDVRVSSDMNNQVTVIAPSDITDTRWEQKNLVWKIMGNNSQEKLPADAKLTLTTVENGSTKTVISSLNQNGEFIIPFDWSSSKEFTFSLSSGQKSTENKTYNLTAVLYVGSQSQEASHPSACEDNLQKASGSVTLTIPLSQEPSLKISSAQKVLLKSQTLKVNVSYRNIDTEACSITAVIRKKGQNGEYNESGNFGQKTISTEGEQDISLASTNGSGSYCLWVTVSKKNTDGSSQILLEVPYYFIIHE